MISHCFDEDLLRNYMYMEHAEKCYMYYIKMINLGIQGSDFLGLMVARARKTGQGSAVSRFAASFIAATAKDIISLHFP